MYKKYGDRIEFLLVYVREAHPTDGVQAARNVQEGVLLASAKSFDEKEEHATSCARNLGIEFPAAVDGMDNKVEKAYSAWPDRYYLIGTDGKIAAKGKPGPAGFKAPLIQAAIDSYLER